MGCLEGRGTCRRGAWERRMPMSLCERGPSRRKTGAHQTPAAERPRGERRVLEQVSASSLPILWCLIPKWAIFLEEIKGSGWKKRQAFSLMSGPFCSWQKVEKPFLDIFAWGPRIPISHSLFTTLCVGYTPPYSPNQAWIGKKERKQVGLGIDSPG